MAYKEREDVEYGDLVIWNMQGKELSETRAKADSWREVVSIQPRPNVDQLLRGSLPFGAVTMLGADPGTGKSSVLVSGGGSRSLWEKVCGPTGLR